MARGGRGGGLIAGAALALLLGAAALIALSLAERRGLLARIAAGTAPERLAPPAQAPVRPAETSSPASVAPETALVSPPDAAPAPPPEASAPAAARQKASAGPEAPAPDAAPPPAWKRNAAEFTAPLGRPLVALALLAPSGPAPDLSALPASSTLVIDASRPDAEALAKLAREKGHEALSAGAFSPDGPWLGGAGLRAFAEGVRAAGGLALVEEAGLDLGGAAPMIGVEMRAAAEDDALAVFAFLRAAAARAAKQGRVVVAMSATPAALRALARWRAVEERAIVAPVSALATARE